MSVHFRIDTDYGVVVSYGTGVFRHADFLEHRARLAQSPLFDPSFRQIVDCRGFTSLDLSHDQLMDVASQSIFSARSRRAFVVSSDLQFGLSRQYASYRDIEAGQVVAVFRSMQEAKMWLGLPADWAPVPEGESGAGVEDA